MSDKSAASSTSSIPDEEEPRLKYQRLEADTGDLLLETEAACLCVSDKMLALGTRDGTVHLLDYDGNEVKRFQAHKGPVNDLCFDETAEFVGSCSDDGGAMVHSLYTDEVSKFKYSRPVKSMALDPRYGSRKTREFMTGGLAGQVVLNSRGWLGAKDNIIHTGEGPVPIIRWAGTLVAWANKVCVRVYDTAAHTRIGKLDRPKSSNAEGTSCQLFWDGEQILYMGWHQTIKVARMRRKGTADVDALRTVEVVVSFQLDNLVVGLAPFGADIAVLVHNPALNGSSPRPPNNLTAAAALSGGTASDATGVSTELQHEPPELKIFTWAREEVAADALFFITGYEDFEASEYALATCYLPRTRASSQVRLNGSGAAAPTGRQATKWWADGEEPIYYVVSPKEIIVGRPRDGGDRVTWLLEHSRYEQALNIIESDVTLAQATREQVAGQYLDFLVSQDNFTEAAALMPRLLKDNAAMWEQWVYMFAQMQRLPAMAPHIPIEHPTLRQTAYEMMLHAFLLNRADHSILLALVKDWPTHLYSATTLTEAVLHRIRAPGGDTEALLQVAAQLYQIQGRYDLALAIYLRQQQPAVFDFIQEHHLLPVLHERVAQLLSIDEERATQLLMDQYDEVPASTVVPSIQAEQQRALDAGDTSEAEVWRHRLHHYLDQLFLKDQTAGADYHVLQVELYADYAPGQLMAFLVSSQWYRLEGALQVCEQRGLVREQVFILGRMGNASDALHLIIQRLADIPQAIEFVQMQRDDQLWELLISLALESPALTGELMDNIGGYVNPLRLLQRIPDGMSVEGLRDRLVHIIADFRTQTSLREGCNTILHTDCLLLAQRLYHEGTKQLHLRRKEGPDDEDLETVWVGIEYPAAAGSDVASQTSNLKFREQRHGKTARQKGMDSQPSLPSLVVADTAILPD
ncbi:hypothetical protein WJX79_002126 [Trebouxia sp. C0005]